jgi:hypothetical protein
MGNAAKVGIREPSAWFRFRIDGDPRDWFASIVPFLTVSAFFAKSKCVTPETLNDLVRVVDPLIDLLDAVLVFVFL